MNLQQSAVQYTVSCWAVFRVQYFWYFICPPVLEFLLRETPSLDEVLINEILRKLKFELKSR
jgi:hypothetical protein